MPKRRGLFLKITINIILIVLVAVSAITYVSIRRESGHLKGHLEEMNQLLAEQVSFAVRNAFYSLNWHYVEDMLNKTADSKDILWINILKPDGELYLGSRKKKYGESVILPILTFDKTGKPDRPFGLSRVDDLTFSILKAIEIGKEKWFLCMGVSLGSIEEMKKKIILDNIMSGSLILLLGCVISFLLSKKISDPIVQLARATHDVSQGKFDQEIHISSNDEIAVLARNFNRMVLSLKHSKKELENRVKERTFELARTNEQLDLELTERKQAEKKLTHTMAKLAYSNAELELFAYIAAHDLQEPLRMVTSYLQLLARRYQNKLDTDADEFIAFAVDGATRMQTLINDLLVYSRVESRGKPFVQADCESVLDQALTNLQVAIEESGAVVTREPLPTLMADEVQLVQLFQNLVENAIKFHGQEPPCVHIAAKPIAECGMRNAESKSEIRNPREASVKDKSEIGWVFSVRDNGVGIDPVYADRIFMIFKRLHGREHPGTGIGLAVCKRIVERHGGKIWVQAEVGKRSTFFFTLPGERVKN